MAHSDLSGLVDDFSARVDNLEKHKTETLAKITALDAEKEGLSLSLVKPTL